MSLRQRLLSQSTMIFGARLFGAGLTFLVQVAIARFLGSQALGEYILVMATVNIIAVVMPLGFEATGTYFAAEYRAKGEGRLLRGFMLRAYAHIAVTGVLIIIIGQPVARLFGEAGTAIASHWTPAAVLAIATAMVFVSGAMLVGLKRPFAGYFAETLFRPLLAIAGFVVAVAFSGGVDGINQILWVLSIGYAVVAVAQLVMLLRSARDIPAGEGAAKTESPALVVFCRAVGGDCRRRRFLLRHRPAAARRPHAARTAGRVRRLHAHLLARRFRRGRGLRRDDARHVRERGAQGPRWLPPQDRRRQPRRLRPVGGAARCRARRCRRSRSGCSVPSSRRVSFRSAILCVGLVVRSVFGPSSIVLSIHNRPYAALPAVGASLAALVAANLLLVPPFGLIGASLAALIAMTVWSGALWLTTLRVAGVDVSIRARLRPSPPLAVKPAE